MKDSMQVVLFVIFWAVAVPTGVAISFFTNDLAPILVGGFVAGIVVAGLVTLGYICFVEKLPIAWQTSYYGHFKAAMILRAEKCLVHPFVDGLMKAYIVNQLDVDFQAGGIGHAKRQLQSFFERVCESEEFALVMAAEMGDMGVPCVIISIKPPQPPK